MGWELYGIVGLVAICVLAGIGWGLHKKADVRVNVLLLGLVLTAVVAMAFGYASNIDGVSQQTFTRLTEAVASDAATATGRITALAQILDNERAFVRDLIAVISIATSAITLVGTAIGFLLRAGNDLTEPHALAVKALADNLPNGEKTAKVDEALVYSLEHLLAQAKNGVLPKHPDTKGD